MSASEGDSPRVVQLLHFDRAEGGSFSLMIAGALRTAIARGWQAEVAVFATPHERPWLAELEATGARLHIAPAELADSTRGQVAWLERTLGRSGPTVLHSHFTSWDLGARFAAPRLSDNHSVIWHIHSALPKKPTVVARTMVKFRLLSRGVDAFLCPAPNLAQGARRRLAPAKRVHFFPSALETARFPLLGAAERRRAREQLGLPADAWVLLHFGWHPYLKGTDRFLRALAELPSHGGRPVHGIVRGGGEETAELAAELGVADRAHAQGPVDDIQTLFGAADAVVAGSREEGMAYSVLESLCSGTPVVATDIPGHSLIGEHVSACRVVGHSPEAIAAGIVETLDRPEQLALEEASEGREWVVNNLGVEIVSGWLVDIYGEALGIEGQATTPRPGWF